MNALRDDERARRGFALALAGAVGIPVLVAVLVALPQGWRKAVFVVGMAAVCAASLRGGTMARTAMLGTTGRRGLAVAGTFLGLILGVTTAVFLFWTLVSLVA